jgi:hypothetical protein
MLWKLHTLLQLVVSHPGFATSTDCPVSRAFKEGLLATETSPAACHLPPFGGRILSPPRKVRLTSANFYRLPSQSAAFPLGELMFIYIYLTTDFPFILPPWNTVWQEQQGAD